MLIILKQVLLLIIKVSIPVAFIKAAMQIKKTTLKLSRPKLDRNTRDTAGFPVAIFLISKLDSVIIKQDGCLHHYVKEMSVFITNLTVSFRVHFSFPISFYIIR